MSLTKTASQAMQYEAASKPSKPNGKQMAIKVADQIGTPSLLWLVIKRHKVMLLAIGNIVLVMNFILPEWPQMVLGLIGK